MTWNVSAGMLHVEVQYFVAQNAFMNITLHSCCVSDQLNGSNDQA